MTSYESLLTTRGPMPAGLVIWRRSPSKWAITVCVKATCTLGEEDALIAEQEPLAADRYWDRDASATLRWPSDFAPSKRRVDVLLSGHAYPPPRTSPMELVARLEIGRLSKSVRVHGDRRFQRSPDGSLQVAQQPIVKVPLRYERAPKDAWNPIGFDPDQTFTEELGVSDSDRHQTLLLGGLAAPNLEPVGGGAAGFSPLTIGWRADVLRMSEEAARWAERFSVAPEPGERVLFVDEPPPPGFDFSIFNAAPPEMQLDQIEAGAPILLEHLHKSYVALRARVPPLHPRVLRGATLLPVRCDTIGIDVERRRIALTFRATVDVDDVCAEHFTVASGDEGQTHEPSGETDEPTSPLPVPASSRLLLTQELDAGSIGPALPFDLHDLLNQTYAGPQSTPAAVLPFEPSLPSALLAPLPPAALAVAPVVSEEAPKPDAPFPVERYALVVAALEAEPTRRAFIFRTHKTTPSAHARLEHRFAREVAEEKAKGASALRRAYDAAYAAAKRRPADELTVSDYAFVVVGVERGEIDRVLDTLGVDLAQLMLVQRTWRRRLSEDRSLAIEVERAITEERRRR